MKKFLGIIICLCMFVGMALCVEELPEDGMDPDYEPENVQVPDEKLIEDTVPVNEPEIEEKDNLVNDEAREDSDYNTVEGEINEIQSGERAITEDTGD